MKAHSSVFNNVHTESVFIHLVLSYSYLPLVKTVHTGSVFPKYGSYM